MPSYPFALFSKATSDKIILLVSTRSDMAIDYTVTSDCDSLSGSSLRGRIVVRTATIPAGLLRVFELTGTGTNSTTLTATLAPGGTIAHEFNALPNDTYSLVVTEKAGSDPSDVRGTDYRSGLVVNCTPAPARNPLEIYDVQLVPARADGTALGSADVFARSVAGAPIEAGAVVEGHLGDQNWTRFANQGTYVSHRFDNLPAGDYTVYLRVNDGQPNLQRSFKVTEQVAAVQIGEQFSFLPWVKHKLGRAATTAPGALRPSLDLKLTTAVSDHNRSLPAEETTTPLALYGPGDVVGLNPAAILRTTPAADEPGFSPLHLASIEFKEEDLPWRYSPAAITSSSQQLRPWCFLLVLEEPEFRTLAQGNAPLPGIEVAATVSLPSFDQLWLWAHVQVNQVLGSSEAEINNFLTGPLQQNPALAFSRLFSARRLKANTRYHAFLLPSSEAGRQAGLAAPGGALSVADAATPAWTDAPARTTPLAFPVYHQWSFQTATGNDFESLARLLQPAATAASGSRLLQVNTPLVAAGSGAASYTLPLPGVLEPLGTVAPKVPDAIARDLYQALRPGFVPGLVGSGGRPVVAPPLYGRAYLDTPDPGLADPANPAGVDPFGSWLGQVNLDPRYRVVAGLGSQLVQERQEEYVERAWAQVQDILVANLNLRSLQFGLETSSALRRQHLPLEPAPASAGLAAPTGSQLLSASADSSLQANSLLADAEPATFLTAAVAPAPVMANYGLQLTGLALPRVRLAATGLSARETIRRSNVPLAAFSPTFRRLLRPLGNYQVNLVGRPLRPTQTPASTATPNPLGPGTSLRQRDELLTRLQTGQVRASAPKEALIRAYQFDDAAFNDLLADANATPTALRVLDEQGYREITDATVLADFGAAFAALRTQTRFRTIDPPQPPLDLEGLKRAMVAGTDPARVLTARAKRALTTVSPFITGDFEFEDFEAEDFLVDPPVDHVTIGVPAKYPVTEALAATDFAATDFLVAAPATQLATGAAFQADASLLAAPDPAASSALQADVSSTATLDAAPGATLAATLDVTSATEPPIKPVMASPVFKDPLGEELQRRHPELVLPGLESFPANSVALMQINHAFIEAYLLGANHALGSELLWRDFPVDLRATYFRQFWDVSDYLHTQPVAAATPAALAEQEERLRDVPPLHTWGPTPLGRHVGAGPQARVVLVARAELLLRFPNTVICALPAHAVAGSTTGALEPNLDPALARYPVYRLPIGQDLVVLAFDISSAVATGADPAQPGGYFFVFMERPGEPQFGLDESGPDDTLDTLRSWNNLSWEYVAVQPGDNLSISPAGKPEAADAVPHVRNSAELAYALFQQPVMVAIPARQLI